MLIYGIPSFRLPKNVVATEVDGLRRSGVDFHLNSVGGRTFTVDELRKEYDAVFIGVGAGLPVFLGVPGENLVGVFSANEYLTRVNLGRAYAFPEQDTPAYLGKHVTVFGAGNVAMDAARTALRMGAESVHIVYRRTKAEMPARREEVEHAEEEGVKFEMLASPVKFNGDAEMKLTSVTLQKMELGEPDASGRRRPVPVEGATYELATDLAIVALGTRSNPILLEATEGLEKTERGYIKVDEATGETSLPSVFAGRRHRHRRGHGHPGHGRRTPGRSGDLPPSARLAGHSVSTSRGGSALPVFFPRALPPSQRVRDLPSSRPSRLSLTGPGRSRRPS